MTTDTKIHDIAVAYILKNAGNRFECPSTTIAALHPLLTRTLSLADGELVLVSAFFSIESWYAFTTRRIVSKYKGVLQSLDPSHGIEDDFRNFKGFAPNSRSPGAMAREVATITVADSHEVVRFEFETWNASLPPMYAARYWQIKHPFLHKLMTTEERTNYRMKTAKNTAA